VFINATAKANGSNIQQRTDSDGAGNIDNGISFYDPIDHVWQAYTRTHGLPADEQAENAVADVYDFAVDRYGVVWAGTEKGLYLLGNDTRGHEMWILHDLDVNGLVSLS